MGSELFWLTGPPPRELARALLRVDDLEVDLVPAAEALEGPADERLLALPAEIAIDFVST